jgi:putative ABC transport system permease protein
MTWLLLSLRRLRADRGTAIGLAVLVGITAFVAAAAPRVLVIVADEALRGEMARASVAQRGIAFGQDGLLSAELEAVHAHGEELAADLPPVVRERLGEPSLLIDSARWVATSAVDTASTIRFRVQPGAMERVRFERGQAPTGRTSETVRDRLGGGGPMTVVRFEGALSVAAAEQLGVEVGDVIELAVDPADLLGRNGQGDMAAMLLTGIFSVSDAADPFWWDDLALVGPTVREVNSNLAYVDASALLADDAYGPLLLRPDAIAPVRYMWRHPALVERFDAASAREVTAALRRIESQYPPVSVVFGQPTSSSGLRLLLEAQASRWGVAEAILAVLAVGAGSVAMAAVALVARMLATRRRAGLALSVGRGATRGQVLRSAVAEGAILAAPAALVGLAIALVLVPAEALRPSALATGGVVLVATAVLAIATSAAVAGRGGVRAESEMGDADRSPARRRLVLEGSVVVLAVLGVVLLRSRGLADGTEAAGTALAAPTVDPLLAAVPALVGLAAGIVTVRTFRIPSAVLDGLAGLPRGLASALAIRRLTRGSGAAPVLLVLLGTASIAAFATALFAHVDRAAEAISWNDVGAAYRVSGSIGRLPEGFEPGRLPGVTASAGAYRGSVPIGDRGARVDLLALDAADYATVVAGTPAASSAEAALAGIRGGTVRVGDPIPVVISTALTTGVGALALGDPIDLTVEGVRVEGRVVGVRDDLPTLPVGGRGALIARDGWPLETPAPSTTTVFLRAPSTTADALLPAIVAAVPGARVADRAAIEADIRSAPVARAVQAGVAAALIVAAAYAALAIAVALALTGAARAVETAHLRLLGLGPRDAVLLVVLEYGPLIGVAFLLGLGLGSVLFLLVRPALGLDVIVGSDLAVPFAVSPLGVLLSLAALIVVAGIGIGAGALAERRAMRSGVIRLGIDRP